ncbi:MAG: hypothetical protein WCP03_04305 [Candidatus Saccharibacteria bacterium]
MATNIIGIIPQSPKTSENTIDNISSGKNGEDIPLVLTINDPRVPTSKRYIVNDAGRKLFFGGQK